MLEQEQISKDARAFFNEMSKLNASQNHNVVYECQKGQKHYLNEKRK